MTAVNKIGTSITAVDLFCGVGGLTYGLRRGGINVAAGIDLDPACRHPFEINNSAVFIQRDVKELAPDVVSKLFKGSNLTLLAGCAPCQPFSTYSQSCKSNRDKSDWSLVASFGKLVQAVNPDFVTMENVPAVEQHSVFKKFLRYLENYYVTWGNVECSQLGVPQTRKRLVLMASKFGFDGLKIPSGQSSITTVRDTIGHLPPLRAGEQDDTDSLHVACRLSDLNLERIRASRPGGTWRDWSPELRAGCHMKASGDTYPSVYGRMEWDQPAPTMTTQCFGYGNGRFGHPDQDRAITLREAAMLQTFPPNYVFLREGEKAKFSRLGRLIGNAVPPRLGQEIARIFRAHVAHYR